MALVLGTRIGPYEITGTLGAGGMGEVYRATDTNLKRAVAIKVLPELVATDRDRLARFQREAEVLASLNHPNIAAIYGLERSAGVTGLVMELVEGPTLADRIAQGPIPVDEALPIAKQIAEALEAAHEQGIIHRDLKPANIKLRPDGTVKVLDFGLAKALAPTAAMGVDASASPTITSPAMMTGVGVLLGTAAYMSPEQARGKAVDKRSDMWAFGCVLYEMLAGKPPFDGEDVTDVLGAVLRLEPDWSALPDTTPALMRAFLKRSLVKDARQRVADFGAALFVIEESPAFGTHPTAGLAHQKRHLRKVLLVTTAVAVCFGVALSAAGFWLLWQSDARPTVRTDIASVNGASLSLQSQSRHVTITPDGSRVIYQGPNALFVRRLDQLEPSAIKLAGDARSLFVSPDGEWIGFFDVDNAMRKVPVTGGPSINVAPPSFNGPRGATWGPDGTIVYATGEPGTGLLRISATGGEPTVMTTPDRARGEGDHVWPEFLPGGRSVLFTITPAIGTGNVAETQIALLDLDTSRQTILLREGSHAHYVPTGHLVYRAGATLRAVRFDLATTSVTGTSVTALEEVGTFQNDGLDLAFAANGTLIYSLGAPVRGDGKREVVWVDRRGAAQTVTTIPANDYRNVRLSPDGESVLVYFENDLWVYDIESGRQTRLTRDGTVTGPLAWDPTGRYVAYTAIRGGSSFNVWVQPSDGTGTARQVTTLDGIVDVDWWSPDGRVLSVHNHRQDGATRMLTVSMEKEGSPAEPFLEAERNAESGVFSPDGRYVAYSSEDSGRREVYIRPYPRSNGRTTVSVGGGREVVWALNGELFYRNQAGDRLMAVSVATQPTLQVGLPREIFAAPFYGGGAVAGAPRAIYDVTKDGQRFLMLREVTADNERIETPRLIVVQNWFEELKRLVPVN